MIEPVFEKGYPNWDAVNNKGKYMTEGPFKAAFDADTSGVVRREIVTYRYKNGVMVKETAVRDYYKDGDYHDTINSMPLVER